MCTQIIDIDIDIMCTALPNSPCTFPQNTAADEKPETTLLLSWGRGGIQRYTGLVEKCRRNGYKTTVATVSIN